MHGTLEQNGYYDQKTNTIHLAADAEGGSLVRVAGHEVTHFIKQWSPKEFDNLRQFVASAISDDFETLVQKKMVDYSAQGINLDYDGAVEEVIADSSELFLTDEKTIRTLATQNRSLSVKIKEFIDDFVKNLRVAMRDLNPRSAEAQLLAKNVDKYTEAQRLWNSAFADAATNAIDANSVQGQGVKFSIRDSDGNDLTQAQAKFFKDSKVRDESGNLLVVYHGGQGSVFNFSRGATRGGLGLAYFTDNFNSANSYARHGGAINLTLDAPVTYDTAYVTKAYLDIRNPLVYDDLTAADIVRTIGKEKLYRYLSESFHSEVEQAEDENGADYVVNNLENFIDATATSDIRVDSEDNFSLLNYPLAKFLIMSGVYDDFVQAGKYDGVLYYDHEAQGRTFVAFSPPKSNPSPIKPRRRTRTSATLNAWARTTTSWANIPAQSLT